LHKA